MSTWIAVDPGFGGTGWAVWPLRRRIRIAHPESTGTVNPPKSGEMEEEERAGFLFNELLRLFDRIGPDRVFIEWPEFFPGTKGHTSAARGDFTRLVLAASIVASAGWWAKAKVHFVPVTMWKGQLTKVVVAKRVAKALQCQTNRYPNHVMDAVGLGLWVMRNLL